MGDGAAPILDLDIQLIDFTGSPVNVKSTPVPNINPLVDNNFSINDPHDSQATGIGLAIKEASLPGFIFRTGNLNGLPQGSTSNRTGIISIGLAAEQIFDQTAVDSTIPPLPISNPMDPSVTISTASIILNNGNFTITLNGTKALLPGAAFAVVDPLTGIAVTVRVPPNGFVNFTYTANIILSPSINPGDPAEILVPGIVAGSPTLIENITGHRITDNLFSSLVNVIAPQVLSDTNANVITFISNALNSSLPTQAASKLPCSAGTNPPATLPSGVFLGIESVKISPSGIAVNPTLACIGNLMSKICPASSANTNNCSLNMLAVSALPFLNLNLFKDIRNTFLLQFSEGKEAVAFYYKHSKEFIQLISSDNYLFMNTAQLVYGLENAFAINIKLEFGIIRKFVLIKNHILMNCSIEMKKDIEYFQASKKFKQIIRNLNNRHDT
jgi:hypothetical protein